MSNYLHGILFFVIIWLFIPLSACEPFKKDPKRQKHTPEAVPELASQNLILTSKQFTSLSEPMLLKEDIARLKHKIDSLCFYYLDNDSILGIAVEYRDLRSGNGFTLFPKKRFIPASLLKIPILIAAFKLEEEKPGSLKTFIPVYEVNDRDIDKNLEENESYAYITGKNYSLNDLVNIMISYSDNRATVSVIEYLNQNSPGIIERVEKDLNATLPLDADNKSEIVYIGHFADILRALYTSSYLSEEHSNAALAILCSSRYQRGFRKSLPGHILIAHKFGVRFNVSELNPEFPVQLHEVALIYHPSNPFILSVMTKGTHVEPLRSALREIAAISYHEIESCSKMR